MPNYLTLPVGPEAPRVVPAVIEIPRGSVNKYEYDKTLHVFRLDRTLYSAVHYPGDYGFIPSTLAGDGDPLDILILVDTPSFPGCLVETRPIGVLRMVDQGKPDEKVIAVATHNPRHRDVHTVSHIAQHTRREIEHFFAIYKDLEGKRVEIQGWGELEETQALIQECIDRFSLPH